MSKIYLLNTSIIPQNFCGNVRVEFTNDRIVKAILSAYDYISAVGHQATADVISTLLKMPIEVNRLQVEVTANDYAIVFQLKSRIPEGKILTREEILDIGYSWKVMFFYWGLDNSRLPENKIFHLLKNVKQKTEKVFLFGCWTEKEDMERCGCNICTHNMKVFDNPYH